MPRITKKPVTETIDQQARDRASENDARITAHEQVCEQVRKRMEEFMVRMSASVDEIKRTNAEGIREIKEALAEHADQDADAFKSVFNRFWFLAVGGYGLLIPLVGYLATKLLKW